MLAVQLVLMSKNIYMDLRKIWESRLLLRHK